MSFMNVAAFVIKQIYEIYNYICPICLFDLSGKPCCNDGAFFIETINVYLCMATPLDVITLQQAKDFLVIDFDDRDAEITRHISAAVGYIEQYTNIMLYSRPKSYAIEGCSVEIYDYPVAITDTTLKVKQNVLSVTVYGVNGYEVTTTVGYANIADIPQPLIEACYKLITYLFENKDIYTAGLPWDVQMLVNKMRRSATI